MSLSDDVSRLFSGAEVERPEIIIGLVGALGTDLGVVTTSLNAALVGVSYQVDVVRVSKLITDFCSQETIGPARPKTALDLPMDLGDALRIGGQSGAVGAALAVGDITRKRSDSEVTERNAHATIIRQLKHPDEVEALRAVYGPRFVLVGAWAPDSERRAEVLRQLRKAHPTKNESWYAKHAIRLLKRDEKDGEQSVYGQRVRDTYELADAYLALIPGRDVGEQARRLVHLLFGSPFETPLPNEQAMYQAAGASLRSSDAGRQVGVVVVDGDGEVVVTGTNEVPRAGGGQYWPGAGADHRDFQYGYDENESQKAQIVVEALAALRAHGWLKTKYRDLTDEELGLTGLEGPLAKTRIGDLLEFGRVEHAEMAAICTAARRGDALRGLIMYTTTYPCHECARLIIATGIARVVYIDPYPKSQVSSMYKHEVSEDVNASGDVVVFEPYRGVAPRLYRSVFTMTGRRRDGQGNYPEWDSGKSRPRLVADARVLTQPVTFEKGFYQRTMEIVYDADWASLGYRGSPSDSSAAQAGRPAEWLADPVSDGDSRDDLGDGSGKD